MDDAQQAQQVADFMSLTGVGDEEFARSFLAASGYNFQEAVETFLGGQGGFAAPAGFGSPAASSAAAAAPAGAVSEDGVRAPILQKRARLFDVNPTVDDSFVQFETER